MYREASDLLGFKTCYLQSRYRPRKIIILCLVISCLHSTGKTPHQIPTKEIFLKTEINRILREQVDHNNIPGAVIQIKQGNRVIYKQAYGNAEKYDFNHRELTSPEKMTVNHLFDIASLTKVVGTTTAIMLLSDRGLLQVDDAVGKYIRAFNSGSKRAITIRNLLTHTAGLYEWYPLYYRASNKQQTYLLIGELPLKYPVGQRRSYSDLGFVLLGEIIEEVSRLPLEQFMELNIFMPLEMKNTGFNPLQSGKVTRIAATSMGNPYEKRMVYDSSLGFAIKGIHPTSWNGWRQYVLKGEVNDGNTWYALGGISGAAGLFSTVEDLQNLVDMLMNKGRVGSRQFIKGTTIATFLTQDKFSNGLGWMMDPDNSFMKTGPEGSFGHTGFTGTSIAVIPKYHLSVILLINRQQMGLLNTGEYYNVNPVRQEVFKTVLSYGN